MVTHRERVKTHVQHRSPCADCPWAKATAIPEWLGPLTKEEWIQTAHGEDKVPCHSFDGPQCAGLAIYRANVCKSPRDRTVLRLPADREKVFASPAEFLQHHDLDRYMAEIKTQKKMSEPCLPTLEDHKKNLDQNFLMVETPFFKWLESNPNIATGDFVEDLVRYFGAANRDGLSQAVERVTGEPYLLGYGLDTYRHLHAHYFRLAYQKVKAATIAAQSDHG